jgi:N-methylhydantoinase A
MRGEDVKSRLELDMRFGNQLVQTTVLSPTPRINSMDDVMALIRQFSADYASRFGKGSEAPEAGIRINTVRVLTYVELETVIFGDISPSKSSVRKILPRPVDVRSCHFVDRQDPLETPFYEIGQLEPGHVLVAPAVVISPVTTYLVEPGWQLEIGEYGAAWFTRSGSPANTSEVAAHVPYA